MKSTSLSAGRPSAKVSSKPTLASMNELTDPVRVGFDLERSERARLKIYAAKQNKTVSDLLRAYVLSLPEQGE